jgi:hypothetical protein
VTSGVVLIAAVGVTVDWLAPGAAEAQVQCSILPEAALLVSFSDNSAPGTITPLALRNFVCSVFPSGAINQTTTVDQTSIVINNNTIELGPIPADTVMSNITSASALPIGNSQSAVFDALLGATPGDVVIRAPTGWIAGTIEHTLGYSFGSGLIVSLGTYPVQRVQVSTMELDSAFVTIESGTLAIAVTQNGTTISACGSIQVIAGSTSVACPTTLTGKPQLAFVVITANGTPTGGGLVQLNWHPIAP